MHLVAANAEMMAAEASVTAIITIAANAEAVDSAAAIILIAEIAAADSAAIQAEETAEMITEAIASVADIEMIAKIINDKSNSTLSSLVNFELLRSN